jgi:hypothetical protein
MSTELSIQKAPDTASGSRCNSGDVSTELGVNAEEAKQIAADSEKTPANSIIEAPRQTVTDIPIPRRCTVPSPINGVIPPGRLFQKGHVSNPLGRMNAAASLADFLNVYASVDRTKLRKVIKGTKNAAVKIAAANLWLRATDADNWQSAHSAIGELADRLLGKARQTAVIEHRRDTRPVTMILDAVFPDPDERMTASEFISRLGKAAAVHHSTELDTPAPLRG